MVLGGPRRDHQPLRDLCVREPFGEQGQHFELTSGQRERLVFKRSGRQLVARQWDRAFWGEGGPGVLYPVR